MFGKLFSGAMEKLKSEKGAVPVSPSPLAEPEVRAANLKIPKATKVPEGEIDLPVGDFILKGVKDKIKIPNRDEVYQKYFSHDSFLHEIFKIKESNFTVEKNPQLNEKGYYYLFATVLKINPNISQLREVAEQGGWVVTEGARYYLFEKEVGPEYFAKKSSNETVH